MGGGMIDKWECARAHGLALDPYIEANVDDIIMLSTRFWDLNVLREVFLVVFAC